ncbi:peptidyl-prolyl cis-trans isomerase [[Clostridium] hylemonae]|uniref:peptidylprolyl isomerase n=1 Tax=[Clostridium] hylemonae TaxID=89153 RepID=UPI001D062F5F|nr:peptidylprolyl isomerase [[Clostridium] hylemonae]MCB7520932.1 peptidyl-prolyl cis-trans isomerase [[Clostridium] hylemonae]
MKKRVLLFAITGLLAAGVLTGCGSIDENDVVATVGEKEITADVANFFARYTQAQYETYYSGYLGDDMWNTDASKGETYEEFVKDSVLNELEKMIVLEEHMGDYDVSLTEEEKAVIEKSAKAFDEANTLESKEKISGSRKTVKRVLTLMAVQKKMAEAIEAGADTEVSDDEAAQKSMQYVLFPYKTTDDSGKSSDLSDEEKAEAKKKAGSFAESAGTADDFSALATEQGVEAQTATFDSESTSPAEDVVKAADALGEGEVTGVIETDSGCYVAKVTSLLDREATDSKKESIVQERKTKLYNDTCDKWIKKAGVKVNKGVWRKVDFNDLSVTIKQSSEEPYSDGAKTDDQAE